MDAGAVGDIEFVMCHMASPIRSLLEGKQFLSEEDGVADRMFDPAAKTWADPTVAGGGYALAQMSHSAGLAYWLTDLKPERVSALTSSPTSAVELYDAFSVRFTRPQLAHSAEQVHSPKINNFKLEHGDIRIRRCAPIDCDRARLELLRHDSNNTNLNLEPRAGAYNGSSARISLIS